MESIIRRALAVAFFAAATSSGAWGQSALDDPDTQRILNSWDRDAAYQQQVLDRAQNYNPSGDQFYPGTNQILQNATDGSGAIRISR